jgi:ABC-type Fe3+ transport system permease subunit
MSANVHHDDRPGDDPRPWEQPGAVRRDCAPHRGRLLNGLATTAVILFLLPPVALLLGSWVLVEAGRDLRLMEAGLMDPAGIPYTRQARLAALGAALVGACLTAGVGALLLATVFGH